MFSKDATPGIPSSKVHHSQTKGGLTMTYTLRVRIIVTAVLLALLLAVSAASPILSDVTGFGGTVSADECIGSSC
jgi:hypothetical protein